MFKAIRRLFVTGKTHLSAGLLVGAVLAVSSQDLNIASAAFTIVAASIGSLIPDIDHTQSMISTSNKTTRIASASLSAVTKHRGFTHTLVFLAIVVGLCNYICTHYFPQYSSLSAAICAGMLSHLLLDTLNEKGIMWLWPLSKHSFHVACVRTGSQAEKVLRFPLNIAASCCVVYILYKYLLQIMNRFVV